MATTKKNITKSTSTKKQYVYSWLTDGEGATEFVVSDSLTTLNFDVGTSSDGTELAAITLNDGNTSASKLKTIATGYLNLKAGDTSTTFYAPTSLSVLGVDATTIFGGAIVANNAYNNYSSYYYGNTASRYEGVDAIVKGDANITVSAVTATAVYGGGAGYGSQLDGDVNLTFNSTNRIGTVYGGGQKGAVVNGDVYITVSRADATEGGRIGTIYGGGENAVVNGDVYITVDGTNAVSVGTISGSGKGNKARVTGERTLEIVDYSGKFASNIKNFDTIKISGSSSVVLTQTQNKTISSAVYEFVLDDEAVNVGQTKAMLTWNKDVDLGQMVITIDGDLDNVENGFSKTIYASSYATSDIIDNILVRTKKADGTYALSSAATSVYELVFVADTDSKGNAKSKGGKVVLNYTGSKVTVDASSTEDLYLSEQGEKVSIKPGEDSNIVRASVNAAGGDDEITVQTETLMAGDINLGEGDNILRVQSDAEVTGSVVVDKNSNNKIYLSGTIDRIEGGDATTNNTVYINSNKAIGFFENTSSAYGDRWDGTDEDREIDATGREATFVQNDLDFTSSSNDTVYVSTSSDYTGNINFAKGADTLVLNNTISGTVTMEDGNDVVVANKSNTVVDAYDLELAGTDNVFVVSNGVKATVENAYAVGDFIGENKKFNGIYLGQNSMLTLGGTTVVSSFTGDIDLAQTGDLTVLPIAESFERIAEWYTAGEGVNARINGTGEDASTITLKEGAVINGTVKDATIKAEGTAGGTALNFNGAKLYVAEDAVLTVGSIDGLDVTEAAVNAEKYYFDDDLAKITLKNDAQVQVTNGTKYGVFGDQAFTVAGPIVSSTSFANVAFIGTIGMTRLASGTVAPVDVTLTNSIAYVGSAATAADDAEFTFNGQNTIYVKSTGGFTLDEQNLTFADDAKASFNVLDDAKLELKGFVNEKDYTKDGKISVDSIGTNARFFYQNSDTTDTVVKTLETADWDRTLVATDVEAADVVAFRDGSKIVNGIDLSGLAKTTDISMSKATVKNNAGSDAIKMNGVWDAANEKGSTLTITDSTVDGEINVTGNGGTVLKGEYATTLTLDNTKVNAVDDGVAVTGDANSLVILKSANINGELNATATSIASTIGDVAGGEVTVVEGKSTITKFTNGTVIVDGADAEAEIGSIASDVAADATILRVMNGAKLTNNDVTMNTDKSATLEVLDATVGAVTQNADAATVKFNYTYTDENGAQQTVYATTAETGAIEQNAATSAKVDAAVKVTQSYTSTNLVDEPLEAKEFDKVSSVITGTIDQKSADNDVLLGVDLYANGKYDTDTTGTLINSDLHKDAVIKVGEIEASYGSVTQEGASNYLDATLRTGVTGEADITVGKATLKMGDVTQTSNVEGTGAWANSLSVIAWAYTDDYGTGGQAKTTLEGEVTGTVGAIKQTAFKNNNYVWLNSGHYSELEDVEENDAIQEGKSYSEIIGDVNKIVLTVASVNMLAYGGENELWLQGNTTVTNDVTVGGVLSGEEYVDYAYGDRTATLNTVDITVDTVTIGGNLALIGLKNVLTLNNESRAEGVTVNAKNVYVAGDDNTVDLDYGVTMNKITLTGLADADKIGQEGYDLGAAAKANTLNVRGTLEGVSISQKGSNDTFNVYGGTINGDIDTKNGNDTINVTGDATTEDKLTTTNASTINGNVTMGLKNDLANDVLAEGDNTVTVAAFTQYKSNKTADKDKNVIGAGNASITGAVSMYSNGTNKIDLDGTVVQEIVETVKTGKSFAGTATISGAVTMDAVAFKEKADKSGYELDATSASANEIDMGILTKIDGAVDMKAYKSNKIDVDASEEIVQGATFNTYAEITGAVAMSANQNAIEVNGVQVALTTEKTTADAAAYMNGISMDQKYTDADGKEYLTNIDTEDRKNTITVGSATSGAQLIVGTSVADLKAVSMGTVEFTKADDAAYNYILDSVTAAERGHDIISYIDSQKAVVKAITDSNDINVVGRFSSADVTMLADKNAITLTGNGTLGYDDTYDVTLADGTTKTVIVADAVRTATFTAGAIDQGAVESNVITANGDGYVNHYELDADGNAYLTTKLESAQFTSGTITQSREDLDADKLTANEVVLTGNIVANTKSISQTGNGQNAPTWGGYTNAVQIEGVNSQVVDEANKIAYEAYAQSSKVDGNIEQISNLKFSDDATKYTAEYYVNGVRLEQTDVTGTITQTVTDVNTAGNDISVFGVLQTVKFYNDVESETDYSTYDRVLASNVAGKDADGNSIIQTGAFNETYLYRSSVAGTVKQVGERGISEYNADGTPKTFFGTSYSFNYIRMSTQTTAAAKFLSGEAEECPAGEQATEYDTEANLNGGSAFTHQAETIKQQAAFNTQSIGGINQTFANNEKATDAAENEAYLTNTNVGAVTQVGTGDVDNIFTQRAADAISMMVEYTGEFDVGTAVSKTATYDVLQKLTAGDIAQTGTTNDVELKSVDAGTITQNSAVKYTTDTYGVVTAADGSNKITLNNVDEVTEAYYNEMTLDETGTEVLTLKKIEASKNDYAKTTTKAIVQNSDAQKNYDNQVTNEITNKESSAYTYYAADTGAITQGVTGAEAKFANVKNTVMLRSSAIQQNTLVKDVDPAINGVKQTTVAVTSTVGGDVTQTGAENTATVVGSIAGAVNQTANLLENYDHNTQKLIGQKVASSANKLTVDGVKDDQVKYDYTDKDGKAATLTLRDETFTKGSVGDVTQTVNDDLAQDGFLDNVVGNNTIDFGSVNTVGADFATVVQETTYGTNTMHAYGATYTVDTATAKAGDNVVLDGTSITQTGKANTVTLDNVALADDAATTEVVEGTITQTAEAVSGNTTVVEEPGKTTTITTMDIGDNGVVISGESSMVGIKQNLENVAYDASVVEETDKDPVKTSGNTNGTNTIRAYNGYKASVLTSHTGVGAASQKDPDVWTNGTFVGNIGDVDQDLTSTATTYTSLDNLNSVVLTDYNAGAIDQLAEGYATNLVTSQVTADTTQYKKDPANEFAAIVDAEATAAMKTTITSVKQTGYRNGVALERTTVSNGIEQHATILASEKVVGETKEWEFAAGDNAIELNQVNVVGGVKSVTDLEIVKEGTTVTSKVAAASTINMVDSNVDNITTGAGNDTLTLGRLTDGTSDATGTKVTGTIDLGSWLKEGKNTDTDTLNIASAKVDLTAATIQNVEQVNVNAGTSLEATSLDVDNITFANGNVSIKAKSVDVSENIKQDSGSVHINADTIALGNVSNASIGAYDDTSTKVDISLNGALTNSEIIGTVGAVDTLAFGADAKFDTTGDKIQDIDKVDITKGASLDKDIKWTDTTDATANTKIDFDFNDYGAGEINGIVIGDISSYGVEDVTFDDGTYTNVAGTSTFTRTGAFSSTDYYMYNDTYGTVTYVA